jgi:hypothetical protein
MRCFVTISLLLGPAFLLLSAARADDGVCRLGAPCPIATLPGENAAVSLGRPVSLQTAGEPQLLPAFLQGQVQQAGWSDAGNGQAPGPSYSGPSTSYQVPPAPAAPVPVPGPAVPAAPPSPVEQYNCGVVNQNPAGGHAFWDKTKQLFSCIPGCGGGCTFDSTGRHHWFESDHCFDSFISPVTNPFYFEDPRALTEVRPIFMWQEAPTGNPIFHGSDIEYFGIQARVAITDWFSLVMTKFGWTWMETHNHVDGFGDGDGFSEIIIGPKFTFLRCESSGTIAAAGLNFDIPVGDSKVFQDTGNLTLEPYLSVGQSFLKSSYGTFNALGTIGYNFSTDRERSDNFFTSLHLDYDVANLHKIYPLMELNWFHYTRNGTTEPINFEGRDLFNFGSQFVAGQNEVSLALGARYKITESFQTGLAAEWQLVGDHSTMDFRVTWDFIIRY